MQTKKKRSAAKRPPPGRPPMGHVATKLIVTLTEPQRSWIGKHMAVKTPFGVAYMSTSAVIRGIIDQTVHSRRGRR